MKSIETTVDHSSSPSLLLSFNTSKGTYLNRSERQSSVTIELYSAETSIGISIVTSGIPTIYHSDTPIDATPLESSYSPSLE